MPRATLWFADEDGSKQSRKFIELLRQSKTIRVRPRPGEDPKDTAGIRAVVQDGEAHHAMIIESGFGKALEQRQLPKLTTRGWRDELQEVLLEQLGEEQGIRLFNRYGDAFRADYCETYTPRVARFDIVKMEQLAHDDMAMTLYQPPDLPPG